MAHLHFRRTAYKSGGKRARAKIDYITRDPSRQTGAAARQLDYIRKEAREDLVFSETRNLPAWAKGDPQAYFAAAERYERGGREARTAGVAFEEWKVTLPHEFSQEQNLALTRDLVDAIAGDRLPITYACHAPATLDGSRQQPHLHLLISARASDGYDRSPAQHFRRYNAAYPERGGARKDPVFNALGAPKRYRVLISDLVNLHLERAGLAARVHPDTLARRQLDRDPEPKLLPSESDRYRKTGEWGPTMRQVLATRAQRAGQWEREQENARSYWEERRVQLDLDRERTREQEVAHIRDLAGQMHAPQWQMTQELDRQRQKGRDLDQRWERPLIGNSNSMIYHTPEHKNYGDVMPANQVHFRTEREAIEAGYRRAANDHYGRGTDRVREAQAVRQRITAREGYAHRLDQAGRVLTTYQQRGVLPPVSVQQGVDRLLADGPPPGGREGTAGGRTGFDERLVLPEGLEDHSSGRAARVRIWDDRRREEERDGRDRRA